MKAIASLPRKTHVYKYAVSSIATLVLYFLIIPFRTNWLAFGPFNGLLESEILALSLFFFVSYRLMKALAPQDATMRDTVAMLCAMLIGCAATELITLLCLSHTPEAYPFWLLEKAVWCMAIAAGWLYFYVNARLRSVYLTCYILAATWLAYWLGCSERLHALMGF